MAEEEKVSPTEVKIRNLIDQLLKIPESEKEKRGEIQAQIQTLRESPQGKADLERHLEMGRES